MVLRMLACAQIYSEFFTYSMSLKKKERGNTDSIPNFWQLKILLMIRAEFDRLISIGSLRCFVRWMGKSHKRVLTLRRYNEKKPESRTIEGGSFSPKYLFNTNSVASPNVSGRRKASDCARVSGFLTLAPRQYFVYLFNHSVRSNCGLFR